MVLRVMCYSYTFYLLRAIPHGFKGSADFRLNLVCALSAYKDYEGWKFMTPCTISFGVFAVLVSASLWAQDKTNELALSLFAVQIAAISVQLGAIFNTPGRGSLPSTSEENKQKGGSENVFIPLADASNFSNDTTTVGKYF